MKRVLILLALCSAAWGANPPGGFTDNSGKFWTIKVIHMEEECGYTDEPHHQVRLDPGCKDMPSVLMHEVMHVVAGVDMSSRNCNYHGLVYVIAPRLVKLFRNNPPLRDYVFKGD